jgi:signal transduction histidine kinase
VERLRLVSDRFGKIGSKPRLEPESLNSRISDMVAYIRRRSPESVNFITRMPENQPVMAPVSGPLFDWVIENLLKNALDALEGKGSITVILAEEAGRALIDVSDTGKGIPANLFGKVFKPGFTTKKRGWGLGLSLSKRIIEQYHKGQLFIRQSEPGKGTTFRIILPR